jgi:hypothetical protein
MLWEQGKIEAALRVERLWDEFARTHKLDVLCGYLLSSFPRGQEHEMLEKISAEHSAVSTL